MTQNGSRSTLQAVAARLRDIATSADEGALLGSEDALLAQLGVARATVRQAARLLEREGLLSVRRGAGGGYYAARPGLATVEAAVSAYLETLDMDPHDATVIASVLWVEVLRRAASLGTPEATEMAERFISRVKRLGETPTYEQILKLEQESRAAIFALTRTRYIELIFQINAAFAIRRFPGERSSEDGAPPALASAWRDAKLLELKSIAVADPELGMMAARHIRSIWRQLVGLPGRF